MQKLDGCAALWVVPSPRCETMQNSSASSVATPGYIESSSVNLMFDRYMEGSPFPIQSNQGVTFATDDMTITHEEADTTIIQQVTFVGAANTLIEADDTYGLLHV